MIVKPSLAISNSIEFGKKWSSPPSMCKGVLALCYGCNFGAILVPPKKKFEKALGESEFSTYRACGTGGARGATGTPRFSKNQYISGL